ncbi:MAG: cupin domain-containing protein [Hyphomicrobium sp.]
MSHVATRNLTYVAVLGTGIVGGIQLGQARETLLPFTPLLSTTRTVMDEPIVYPTGGAAKLTAGIVAMAPGQETGWHTHGVPLTGIVLEGELTVDYGDKGTRTYREGQSIAEAIAVPHNGRNSGTGIMRLFAVYIGAEGVPNMTPMAAPAAKPQ